MKTKHIHSYFYIQGPRLIIYGGPPHQEPRIIYQAVERGLKEKINEFLRKNFCRAGKGRGVTEEKILTNGSGSLWWEARDHGLPPFNTGVLELNFYGFSV